MKPTLEDPACVRRRYAPYRARLCQADDRLDARLRGGALEAGSFSLVSRAYDLVLLDAFGVLYRGREAIAGAVAAVQRLQEAGRNLLLLSNNASQSPERLARQLGKLGFAIPQGAILTSGMAVRPFVAASSYQGLPYYLVGTDDSLTAYAPDPSALCVNRREGDGWQAACYILLCSNRDYYGSLQQTQVEWLLARKGLPVLLANPDLTTPEADGGLSPVAGYTATEWVERFRVPWLGLGKPFPPLYALVRQRFPEIPPARCLMVGDTLETDILGAAAQGFASCLTLSGACAGVGEGLEALCDRQGIRPDFVVPSIADS
ncbi:MAG: HAD hydrolase-like protein [Magnetococcus sp. MYC-9]